VRAAEKTVAARGRRSRTATDARWQLPPLTMVRAFEATGRMGTMRKAADDISVSHTVVSRHVRNLEAWIDRKLVIAGPRGVILTKEGELFFSTVSKAFQMIGNAALELRSLDRRRTLKIWSTPGLATRWLIPRWSSFEATLPGTEIILRAMEDQLSDFTNSDADLVVGFGDLQNLPEGAVPLIQPRVFPVASSEWIRKRGAPATLAGLVDFPLIHEENRQRWTAWFAAAGIKLDRPLTGPRLWDANLRLDAVLAGQGIALDTGVTTTEDIASGRLVELFDTDIRLGGYYLVAPAGGWDDPLIARLREWLETNIRATDHAATFSKRNRLSGGGQKSSHHPAALGSR
jgi:LysR family transcriptional regulator, glycine cleavage system transcriptional activator